MVGGADPHRRPRGLVARDLDLLAIVTGPQGRLEAAPGETDKTDMASVHRFYLAALVTVLALALAVPAFGGPSLGQAAKTAKKALGLAKKADKRARTANRRALLAGREALAANGNAGRAIDQANAAVNYAKSLPTSGIGPWDGPENPVPVGQAVSSIATCPAGTRVISGGGFANTSEGIIASRASSDRTAWFVLTGENVSPGTVQAVAYCARTGNYTIAHRQSGVRREVEALERQYLERLR